MIPAGSIPLSALAALTASRVVVSDAAGLLTVNAAGTANRLAYWGSAGALAVNAALTQNRVVIGDANGLPTPAAAILADRVLISDANGVPTHSTITAAQLAALTSGALVWISQQVASASSTIVFTGLNVYDRYRVTFRNLRASSDQVQLQLRCSANGGSSYDTGAGYEWANTSVSSGSASRDVGAAGDTRMILTGNANNWAMGNANAFESYSGWVELTQWGDASANTQAAFMWMHGGKSDAGIQVHHSGSGYWGGVGGTSLVNAIQFSPSGGNFTTGTFNLYGLRDS